MGYLNTPVWRKPFPSWNFEGVVIAPALKEMKLNSIQVGGSFVI